MITLCFSKTKSFQCLYLIFHTARSALLSSAMDFSRVTYRLLRQAGPSVHRSSPLPVPLPGFARQPHPHLSAPKRIQRPITTTTQPQNPAAATAEKEIEIVEDVPESPPNASKPVQPLTGQEATTAIPQSTGAPSTPRRQISEAETQKLTQLDELKEVLGQRPQYDRNRPPTGRITELQTSTGRDGAQRQATNTSRVDVSRMSIPGKPAEPFVNKFVAGSDTSLVPKTVVVPDTEAPPFRIGPSLGRTVKVETRDLAASFRSLDMQVARNRVRADMNKQRFHERPGLKRKRLHSERWRRRFKADFQAVCRRVEELRRKGW